MSTPEGAAAAESDPLSLKIEPALAGIMTALLIGRFDVAIDQLEQTVACMAAHTIQPPPYTLVWNVRSVADAFFAVEAALSPAAGARLAAYVTALDRMLAEAAAVVNAASQADHRER